MYSGKGLTVEYKFAHDRIQQAAYSLISSDSEKASHSHAEYRAITVTAIIPPKSNFPEKIFEIVNQLNLGT